MKFFAALLGVLAFLGCKHAETSGLSGEVAPQKSVLLVGFGGWNSCRLQTDLKQLPTPQGFISQGQTALSSLLTPKESFTYGQLLNLAKTLTAAGVDVKWMSTCFFVGLPVERSIWFLNSDGRTGHVPSLAISDEIKEFAGDREIILIGHSYGGWMSATVSTNINRPVLATFTLEPISGESCPTSAALTGTASQYEYCQRAPDANSVDLARAQDNVRTWINVYLEPEGRDLDIYSGPYPAPVENVTLSFKNLDPGPFGNAHHLLGLDKKTWDLICTRSAALLNVSGACNGLNVDQWGRELHEPH